MQQFDLADINERLGVCSYRKGLYQQLHQKQELSKYANLIRYLLDKEMQVRHESWYVKGYKPKDTYDFECFYWCMFLLFRVRDISDVKLLWKAANASRKSGGVSKEVHF